MATIEVKNLYKIFGHQPKRAFPLLEQGKSKEEILDAIGCVVGINDATFEVKEKETFVIMGLSGSGKSTVIRCLNRLIEPTRGQVLIDGDDIMKMNRNQLLATRRTKLSMVFQHFGLLPHRSVISNVEYGLEISKVDADERRKKALDALELVGLKGYETSKPNELSGGMQQRVGLARALANDPEVLLMDEAFSALDPLIRNQMQDELLDLQAKMHKTIVFITHDLDEALKIGDRIAIMKDGAVVQIGTPEEILTEPANDYVRAFVQNVDRTKVIQTSSIMHKVPTVTVPKDGPRVAVRTMEREGKSTVFVVDEDRRLKGIVTIDDALELEKQKARQLEDRVLDEVFVTTPETPIADLLSTALQAKYPIAVLDGEGKLKGVVDRATVMAEVLEGEENEGGPVPLNEATKAGEEAAEDEGSEEEKSND
jgi:glycine betaine/proline transport system ATP-binding protein